MSSATGPEPEWLSTNRALWEEMAAIHPTTDFYDVAEVVDGRDDLRPRGAPGAG